MSIPLATTVISIYRRPDQSNVDPWDATIPGTDQAAPTATAVATGIRAVIGQPSGSERLQGGSQMVITDHLTCDPTDLRHTDQVRDEISGQWFAVVTTQLRTGLGLDHVESSLKRVVGQV